MHIEALVVEADKCIGRLWIPLKIRTTLHNYSNPRRQEQKLVLEIRQIRSLSR
jgi:hypothetical protein